MTNLKENLMKKMVLSLFGALVVLGFSQAIQAENVSYCDPCDAVSCDPCEPVCGPKKSLWFWGGHLEGGLWSNEYGVTDIHGADWGYPGAGLIYPGNTNYLHNARQTDAQLNQLYLNLGKKLSKRGWDVGGQVDFMYGTDARYVQSQGMEYGAGRGAWDGGDYYTALPQMFVEVGYDNVSVKAGKFLNPMGHNSVLSTDRFFYTLSDSFAMTPVTQSGVLATWEANKKLSVFGGWTSGYMSDYGIMNGWGSSANYLSRADSFFDSSDNNAFLGGFEFKLNKRVNVRYAVLIGKDETTPPDNVLFNVNENDRDYFMQSLVVDVKLNRKWDYTFEWTLRNEKNEGTFNEREDKFYWGGYGINQELIYKYNKKWSFGLRAEWVHLYESNHYWNSQVPQEPVRGAFDCEKYSFVLGANWSPRSWILVRPELRYDKFDGVSPYYERWDGALGRNRDKQLSGGVSAIVKF